MDDHDSARYRQVIDRLVSACQDGQGQIGRRRAIAGVWNPAASHDEIPDQHDFNVLLAAMGEAERETLGRMLEEQFQSGVHETLATPYEEAVRPFDDGYEGTPFHDFVGRLAGWEWPER